MNECNSASMADVVAITLDLDDTLWPIGPVIEIAERRLYDWLAMNCPRVTRTHDLDAIRRLRLSIARDHADIAHDLTEVRRRVLERLIVTEGSYPSQFVEYAMSEFLEHRNAVELYPDALSFLTAVSTIFPLLSISNGNADLARIGLDGLFVSHVCARDVGAAKPDSRPFLAACARLGVAPERVLHIGDHPVQDILGAARVGMKTIWVNRSGARWEEDFSADHEVTSLEQILDLLPPRGT